MSRTNEAYVPPLEHPLPTSGTDTRYQKPYRKIKRKWIETIEIKGAGRYDLQPGQRVIDSRIVHEVVEVKQPGKFSSSASRTRMPEHKTIIVLECVEYEQ